MGNFRVLSLITPVSYPRIGGVSRFADAHGWTLILHDRLFGIKPSTAYDGVLVTLRENADVLAYVRALRRRKIPVVDLTIEHPEIRLPRVISDHRAIGREAARHFAARGFAQTAWFSTRWSPVHQLRYEGLAGGCATAPLKLVAVDEADIRRWAVALPKPLAVLTYDETDAQLLLNICLLAHLAVPDEIAILSIGDDPLVIRHQAVPLSCIQLNPSRSGYAAAALLDRLMRGGNAPSRPILIRPDGISIRQSTDTFAHANPLIRNVLLYIRDNLTHPFGAEQVADALGESRSRLDKACAASFGHSLGREILLRRLAEAQRLLKGTDADLSAIASGTGFCSSAYFIKKFHDTFGVTPRTWRKAVQSPAGEGSGRDRRQA